MLKNEHYLKNHIRQVHGDGPKGIFKCNKCDKAFDRSRYLKLHNLRTHEEKPYSCDECPVSFANLSLLRYHVNRRHTGERPKEVDIIFNLRFSCLTNRNDKK